MTVKEMHVGVNLQLQEIASFKYDDFLPQEIDYYLNKAISRFVERQKDAARDERAEDPSSEKAWESIRTLIKQNTFSSQGSPGFQKADGFDEVMKIDVYSEINDFYYYLSSRTTLSNGSNGRGEKVNNRYMNSEKFIQKVAQPDDKPIFSEFPVMTTEQSIYIAPSYDLKDLFGPDITELWLLYVSKPAKVNLENDDSSDLPEHTHDDIVDLAVNLMKRDLGSTPNGDN